MLNSFHHPLSTFRACDNVKRFLASSFFFCCSTIQYTYYNSFLLGFVCGGVEIKDTDNCRT